MSSHSRLTWLFEMPLSPMACTRSSTRRVETPCTSSLLDHRRQRLLGGPAGFEKPREVRARSQLWNAKVQRSQPGLPVPIPVAIALRRALGALLTIGGAGLATDLQIHQALGGEADHLAQQIRITALLYELSQVHHRFGHRGYPWECPIFCV